MIQAKRNWQHTAMTVLLLWLPYCYAQGQVELQLPEPGFYKPDDPLVFLVPEDIPVEKLQHLSMELDGFDVTSFISREGDRAIFRPPQPLAYGPHQIRLVEYLPDGSINELALYNVDVRKSSLLRQVDVAVSADLSAIHRLAENHLDTDIARDQQNGGAIFSAKAADGDWQAGADMDLIYNSQLNQTANDRRLDLANGTMSFSRGAMSALAGDQVIPGSGMVLNDYARRGVSGTLHLGELHSEFTGFALRSDPLSGFSHWPGMTDENNRAQGIFWTFTPLTQQPERLHITSTYLEGEGSSSGEAVAGNSEVVSNHAGSVVVDSQIWDQRLQLRGEYAYSNTDLDASGNLLDESGDNALDLMAIYNQPQRELLGSAFYWNVGAQHKRVGLSFYSLGNVGQETDTIIDQVFGEMNWGGLALGGKINRLMDNIDDDPRFPHLFTDGIGFWTRYSPTELSQPTGIMQLFANPTFTFTGDHVSRKYKDTPVVFAGDDIDEVVDLITVGMNFAPGSWNWDIMQTYEHTQDYTGAISDSRRDNTHVSLAVPVTEYLTLSSGFDYDRTREFDNNTESKSYIGNITASINAMDNRLSADISYDYQRDIGDGLDDNSDYTVQASTSWVAIEAKPSHPGLSLFLNGSYQHDQESCEIFAGVTVNWQAQY